MRKGKSFRLARRVEAGERVKLATVTCGRCQGSGGDPMVGGKCPACSGRGTVMIGEPHTQCSHCRGSGLEFNRQGHPTSMVCIACRGKGVVHVSGPTKECGACGGTGTDPKNEFGLPCVVCSGKGVVRSFEVQT